jgi:hypothetical protein
MKFKRILAFSFVILTTLACSTPTGNEQPSPMVPSELSGVWLRTAGDLKADQSWAVETDDMGNLY